MDDDAPGGAIMQVMAAQQLVSGYLIGRLIEAGVVDREHVLAFCKGLSSGHPEPIVRIMFAGLGGALTMPPAAPDDVLH